LIITNNINSFIQKKPSSSFIAGTTLAIGNSSSITFTTTLPPQNSSCFDVHYHLILNYPAFWANMDSGKVVTSSIVLVRIRNQNDEHIDNLQFPMQVQLPLRYKLQQSNQLPSASCVVFNYTSQSWIVNGSQVLAVTNDYITCSVLNRGLIGVIASSNEVQIDDPFQPYYVCGDGICHPTIENCTNCSTDCGNCNNNKVDNTALIVGVVVGSASLILIIIAGVNWYRRRRSTKIDQQKVSLLQPEDREEE